MQHINTAVLHTGRKQHKQTDVVEQSVQVVIVVAQHLFALRLGRSSRTSTRSSTRSRSLAARHSVSDEAGGEAASGTLRWVATGAVAASRRSA